MTRLTSEFGPQRFYAGLPISVFLLPPSGFSLPAHRSGPLPIVAPDFRLQASLFLFSQTLLAAIFPPNAPALQLQSPTQLHVLSRSLERR